MVNKAINKYFKKKSMNIEGIQVNFGECIYNILELDKQIKLDVDTNNIVKKEKIGKKFYNIKWDENKENLLKKVMQMFNDNDYDNFKLLKGIYISLVCKLYNI